MIRRSSRWVALLVIVALSYSLSGCSGHDGRAPTARQGLVDLSGSGEVLTASSIDLDGEWAFYWKQLLTPEDFRGPQPPPASAHLRLPGAWNGLKVDGTSIDGDGFATFRLRILTGATPGDLALHLGTIESAYRLWANGTLVSENGVIGMNAAAETPAQSSRLVRLPPGRPLELVLQVSNFHYREGGVLSPIELGAPDWLESARLRKWAVVSLCIGAIAVMGLYHLVFYAFRRNNMATLYFGVYCLLWTGYLLTSDSSDWVVNLLSQRIPVPLLNRVDLMCFVLSVPVCYAFFRSLYPEEFSRRLGQATWALATLFTAMGVVLPTLAFTSAIPIYYAFAAVMILYFLARLFVAVRRKREGASFILLGFIVLGGAGINDMLYDMQVIRSAFLMHIGLLVFVLCQAFALSLRFSMAFTAVERLSAELGDKNLSLEQEMNESNRLAREIVNVSEDERRHISYELHDGLCQQLTGARLHFSVLRRKLAGTVRQDPEWGQLASMLEGLVDHAYELSHGLWPVDHDGHGVSPSLEELAHRLSATSGIAIELLEDRGCDICRNPAVTQLYRIAQEAITNSVRHARADRITVTFDCSDRKIMSLSVRDDGIGRDRAARSGGGLGMRIMAHRAQILGGHLEIADAPEGGTVVSCTALCEAMTKQEQRP
jgi:signal transduction histidine kinase